jgi:hypothetical protein
MPSGEWSVVVGKAQIIDPPGVYHIIVTLRDAPTLAPQTDRAPYVPVAPLKTEARWYAGDFHVHSRESGDARPTMDAIAKFAMSRGLVTLFLSIIICAVERMPLLTSNGIGLRNVK